MSVDKNFRKLTSTHMYAVMDSRSRDKGDRLSESKRRQYSGFENDDRPRKRRSVTPLESDSRSHHRSRRYEKQESRRRSSDSAEESDRVHKGRSSRDYDEERQLVKRWKEDDGKERHRNPRSRSRSPRRHDRELTRRNRDPLPPQDAVYKPDSVVVKEKPNFANTGKLAAAANTIQTAGQDIILKYHEPTEARKPPSKDAWRIYVFKDDEIVDTLELYEQSCWLFGRELAVVDVPLEHPSCSKQHAVLQFRYVERRNEFGDKISRVRPYIIDLESTHGTFVNRERIPDAKYYELRDKDMVKFGKSRREYVVQLPTRSTAS